MTRLTRRLHNAGIADESAFLVTDPVKGAGPRSRLILHETRVLSLECAILYTVMADVQERRVFISSTFRDLLEERRKVLEAVLELKAFPSGTEMFPSADDEQWEFIKREIDSSDYYVLVVAGKYGSLAPEGVSYTEKEYEYALAAGTPVLTFLCHELGELKGVLSRKLEG